MLKGLLERVVGEDCCLRIGQSGELKASGALCGANRPEGERTAILLYDCHLGDRMNLKVILRAHRNTDYEAGNEGLVGKNYMPELR